VLVGVVALVDVLVVVLVLVLVGVLVLVLVLVLLEVELELDVLLVLVVLVGIEGVDAVRWWQSVWASCAIVPAAWVRLLRRVELIVTGRAWTSFWRTPLALAAAGQLPDCTAEEMAAAWVLRALD
jgi:hypothetical protein